LNLRRNILAAVFVPCLPAPGDAAEDEAARDPVPVRTVRAVRVAAGPRIDGRLDDEVWRLAPDGGPLVQVTPHEGAPPTERTEFRILFDERSLYVGVWCFDREPERIAAAEMALDGKIDSDDHVAIALDTFLDRRNGYQFRINPNGAREDALISNNAELNRNWDGIWTAAASIDGEGWYCEAAIPFQTLIFARGSTVWGLNVARKIPRKIEEDRWSGASDRFRTQNVAEAGQVTGLEALKRGIGIDLVPYGIARYRNEREPDDSDTLFDAGADLRYSITPNLTATLSYDTDFAETEVDARQINLTRFPLFFPEKRDFFLQDAGIFEFAGLGSAGSQFLLPFFSRRIGLSETGERVPIVAAGKLTGRVGSYNIGLLDALVEDHAGLPMRNAFVGRLSRNVLDGSSIGGIVTHGDPNSLDDNLLAGADFNFRDSRLVKDWVIQGSAFGLGTWTEDVEGEENFAFGARLSGESDVIYTGAAFYQIEENFNAALGFVPRRDIRGYEGELTYRPLVESIDAIRRIWVSFFTRSITDLDDELESSLQSLTPIYIQFESGDDVFINTQLQFEELMQPFEIHPGVVIPPDEYWFLHYRAGFITASKRRVEFELTCDIGDFYDGWRQSYDAGFRLKPLKHLFAGLGYELNQVRLPEGDFDTRLAFVRVQVNFTTNLIWFNLVQYDDLSDTIGVNSRLQWEFRPGSFLYLVLQENAGRNHGDLRSEETEAAAKVAVTFRF